jgi:hypothetical protein
MTPLLVVLPTHPGDVDRAETLLKWIKELGNVSEHSLMIAADAAIPQERVKALLSIVREEFHSVRAMIVNTGAVGWPLAANLMFRAVARQISDLYKLDWLWLEPDSVMLDISWLNAIAEEYRLCPRPFMGCLIDNEKSSDTLPKRFLAGTAVYPQDTFGLLATRWSDAKFTGPSAPKKVGMEWKQTAGAWDMTFADFFVPRAQHTDLIQHFWGTSYTTPPVFKAVRTEADPENVVTFDLIKPHTLLFHRVKDLEGFLALWRVRLQHGAALEEMPASVAELGTEAPKTPSPFGLPAEGNANFKGGAETLKERRQAAAQKSKEYLEQARAQHARAQQQFEQPSAV